jgi:uncharacterized protein (DUF2236 family)
LEDSQITHLKHTVHDGKKYSPKINNTPCSPATENNSNGWFAPGSAIRLVSQEALGLLGGGRAVLLQLAHPLVAAGVLQHSDFQTDPLSRLLETLELMHTLIFGDRPTAQSALNRFYAIHASVQGRLPQEAGGYPAGSPYKASDPHLKLWVAATLIDTSLITYERFVAGLSPAERESFYQESIKLARLLKIPPRVMPPTLSAFREYMAAMLDGDALQVDELAKRLAQAVLHPRDVGMIPAASAGLLRFVTAGLLPVRYREAYGLSWGHRQQVILDGLSLMTRALRPWAPAWVWQSPMLGGGLARFLLSKHDPLTH